MNYTSDYQAFNERCPLSSSPVACFLISMEFFVLGASFVQTELVGISLIKNKTKKEKKKS